jgi:hypothetical protein
MILNLQVQWHLGLFAFYSVVLHEKYTNKRSLVIDVFKYGVL